MSAPFELKSSEEILREVDEILVEIWQSEQTPVPLDAALYPRLQEENLP